MNIIFSDNYAHKCCKYNGIKSITRKKYRYTSNERPYIYPNLLIKDLNITTQLQVIVSDMAAFWAKATYYELTLYVDLFNNEIISYAISTTRGDNKTYIKGLEDLLEIKKEHPELKTILHTDQGSVYSSKSYNEFLPLYNIVHSMSRAGTPTDNAFMESINGWLKEELFIDFKIPLTDDPIKAINEYVNFFNYERPTYYLVFNSYSILLNSILFKDTL